MSENYNLDALFHPKVDIGEQTSKNLTEYNPTADKGKNGVYDSVIRFVSWWQEPEHSIFEKWVCWLVDPITERGRFVDCPSSVGKPSILQDMFFKLRKSESVQERQKSEIFSRRHSFTSIIQIIRDEQNRDLEGRLMIWKFGKKIFEKIEAEKKPILGEPHEPFDLIDGKAFQLRITKVAGFNNYDQSKFISQKIPLVLPIGKDGKLVPFGPDVAKLQPINDRIPREIVFKFLKDNSPDLSAYGFKEWDQETHDYVNQVILAVTGKTPSTSYADVRNSKQGVGEPQKSNITASELSVEDLNLESPSLDLDIPDLKPSGDSFGISGDLDDFLGNI